MAWSDAARLAAAEARKRRHGGSGPRGEAHQKLRNEVASGIRASRAVLRQNYKNMSVAKRNAVVRSSMKSFGVLKKV